MNNHNLIKNYTEFIHTIDGNPFGFLSEKKEINFEFVNENAKPNLEVIGKNKAGCLICIYKSVSTNLEKVEPVIWLDSEGWPNAVIADNIKMFFSILPYGTGYIYDIISKIINIDNKCVNDLVCKELDKPNEFSSNEKVRSQTLTTYEGIMQVSLSRDPCSVILNTIKNFQYLIYQIIKE